MKPKIRRQVIQKPRNTYNVIIVLLLIFSVGFGGIFIKLKTKLATQERVTLVFNTSPIWVMTFNNRIDNIGLVRIPDDTYVNVPGYGSYKLSSLWRLGTIENKKGKILVAAMQAFLGAPIDGWVGFNDAPLQIDGAADRVISTLSSRFSLLPIIKGKLSLSFQWLDYALIWWSINHASTDRIVDIDLAQKQVFTRDKLADDTDIERGDPELVDKVSQHIFLEETIQNEKLVFRVHNGSDITGLAASVTRLLTNIGAKIVSIDTVDHRSHCTIEVPQKQSKDNAIIRIATILNCTVTINNRVSLESNIYLGQK